MWLTLAPLLIKYVLPVILNELVKSGVISQLTANGIKDFEDFKMFIKNLKYYSAPTDFPDAPPMPTPDNVTPANVPDPQYPTGKNGV